MWDPRQAPVEIEDGGPGITPSLMLEASASESGSVCTWCIPDVLWRQLVLCTSTTGPLNVVIGVPAFPLLGLRTSALDCPTPAVHSDDGSPVEPSDRPLARAFGKQ
jgi:hypothetical protein